MLRHWQAHRKAHHHKMGLFDEFERADIGYALHAESGFSFLNRTARAEYVCLRKLLESWFQQLPDGGNGNRDLQERFRSDQDREHQAAFFELYVSALLRALPARVVVHPTVDPTMATTPDFLAILDAASGASDLDSSIVDDAVPSASSMSTIGSEQGLFVECRIDSEPNADTGAHMRLRQLLDELNSMPSPDFFFMASVRRVGRRSPSARRIIGFLQERLQNANPGEALKRIVENPGLEEWVWRSDDGWAIEFLPAQKTAGMKETENFRTIVGLDFGNINGELFVDGINSLRKALEAKRPGRYGRFTLSYVIAVNVLNPFTDELDISEVLYRHEAYFGPTRNEVSAVLVLRRLNCASPESIASAAPTMWHNPNATFKLSKGLWPGDQAYWNDTIPNYEIRRGRPTREILGLGGEWPRICS